MKISCSLLLLALLGSTYAQYQYPQQGIDAGAAVGANPSPGGVNNRIFGLLGGGGNGIGGGGIGSLFTNLFGGLLGGGRGQASYGQTYPLPPSYAAGYPGYGYGGALGNGYAGNYPGNNFGGGFAPGYGYYQG